VLRCGGRCNSLPSCCAVYIGLVFEFTPVQSRAGFFVPAVAWRPILKKITIMNFQEELRRDCVESIVVGLTKTSDFRLRKATQYPDDKRNAAASASLKKLAHNATDLSDSEWQLLQLFFDPKSKTWQDAICQATKDVGFSNRSRSFPYFIRCLIAQLPHHQTAVN
jgi:hypothetical protein